MGKFMHFPWGRRYHRMGIWWKKVPILWGKYGYQFPRLSQFNGFHCIFQCYGKLMGKPKHFPCDEVYYRMGIWLEKSTNTMGKVCVPISQPFLRVLLHFLVLWEIDGETRAFPILQDSLIFSCDTSFMAIMIHVFLCYVGQDIFEDYSSNLTKRGTA